MKSPSIVGLQYQRGKPGRPGNGLATFAACRVAVSCDLRQPSSSSEPEQDVSLTNRSNCHSSSET